ncbi:MAG: diacylglycerol/polyprenol kinase family protein [Myxococcota bacterium]
MTPYRVRRVMRSPSVSSPGHVAWELHALLKETDPVRWRDRFARRAMERWARLGATVEELCTAPSADPDLDDALEDVARVLRGTPLPTGPPRRQWAELRARLVPAYERLSAALRARALPVPSIRPTNGSRIAFHVTSALGALLLLEVVLTRAGTVWATGLFAGTFWLLEGGRALSTRVNDRLMKVRFFQRIIHPHEHHRVNSATWYATALVLLAVTSPVFASAVGLAVLGLGDPVAGLIGRRYGRTPLGGGRTAEGSAAFVLAGTFGALAVLLLWHAALPVWMAVGVASAGGLAGAAAELLSRRVDDNFMVPVAAAAAAWGVAILLGAPL